VGSVADRLGVSVRHLHRAFTENVGVGPKEYARAVRLQRALRLAATSRDWPRIAADTGYLTQAQLIGDFRQLVGITPDALTKRQRLGAGS
jgi:AraC-like DNA-binding protein